MAVISALSTSLIFAPVGFIPVSYTHLDVYKRQAGHAEVWKLFVGESS